MYAKRDGPGLTQVQFEDARPSPYDHVNPSYNVYYACIITYFYHFKWICRLKGKRWRDRLCSEFGRGMNGRSKREGEEERESLYTYDEI